MKNRLLVLSNVQFLKVLSIAFVMLFSFGAAKAQFVNIPDASLKGIILNAVPHADPDDITTAEAAAY